MTCLVLIATACDMQLDLALREVTVLSDAEGALAVDTPEICNAPQLSCGVRIAYIVAQGECVLTSLASCFNCVVFCVDVL